MAPKDLNAPALYINRELSWLEFNHRVLEQGRSRDVPLMERLKFLAIVSSNLDEFFMVRVGGLKQQVAAGVRRADFSGLTPGRQLERIAERAHAMVADQSAAIQAALAELAGHGLRLSDLSELTTAQRAAADRHFADCLLPVLTPLAVDELDPFPVLPGLGLNLALLLDSPAAAAPEAAGGAGVPRAAIVPIPGNLHRFVPVGGEDGLQLVRLEEIIARNVGRLFPDNVIAARAVFRFTRDADVPIDDDAAADLLEEVERAVLDRRRSSVVRLEIEARPDPRLRDWLVRWCGVRKQDVYEVPGLLDARALMDLASRPGFDRLRAPEWQPQTPRDLLGSDDLWTSLQEHDVLLFHPYESFEPVVQLLERAAADPNVLAIKQTLYRTSGDSPIVAALARAAAAGKQVTVLVELKARFDEASNVNWARRLEDAGCHVIYGIVGLKTHGKVLLIVRREPRGLRRYVHLSTGNYNDRTARLYSDIGLMTTDPDFALDAAAFFNLLTGYSQSVGWAKFAISPRGVRERTLEMIRREIEASSLDQPGLIMAKVNSLQDPLICRALYEASAAGVRVRLNVRGICCLRPGLKGVSENIEVVSIVDRYLEHARVFYFRNGGREEVYLSSADWMRRNLDRRLEIMFPVVEPARHSRLVRILGTFFRDNVQSWRLTPEGAYERVKRRGKAVRAQEEFHSAAVAAVRAEEKRAIQFKPMMRPEEPPGH